MKIECSQCGAPNDFNNKHCWRCGKDLEAQRGAIVAIGALIGISAIIAGIIALLSPAFSWLGRQPAVQWLGERGKSLLRGMLHGLGWGFLWLLGVALSLSLAQGAGIEAGTALGVVIAVGSLVGWAALILFAIRKIAARRGEPGPPAYRAGMALVPIAMMGALMVGLYASWHEEREKKAQAAAPEQAVVSSTVASVTTAAVDGKPVAEGVTQPIAQSLPDGGADAVLTGTEPQVAAASSIDPPWAAYEVPLFPGPYALPADSDFESARGAAPNLAGKYFIAAIPCGTGCRFYRVADLATGQVLEDWGENYKLLMQEADPAAEPSPLITGMPDSKLVVLDLDLDRSGKNCRRAFSVLEEGQFQTLVKPFPVTCSSAG